MSWGVDEVNEEFVAFCRLLGLYVENVFVVQLGVERNSSGLDGNAPFLDRLVFISYRMISYLLVRPGVKLSLRSN